MKRSLLLKIVNFALTVLFLTQATTGVLLIFIPSSAIAVVHQYTGCALILFALAHIFLNLTWFKTNLLNMQPRPPRVAVKRPK